MSEAVALAKALRDVGIDMIDVSSGGIAGSSNMPMVPRIPAYQPAFLGGFEGRQMLAPSRLAE